MAKKKKGKAKKSFGWQIMLITVFLLAVMFSAMAVLLVIGMVPTIVACIVDRSDNRVKTITVGSMNFAGCVPFMLQLLKTHGGITDAMGVILQPQTIVIMYFAAAMGYMIDWAMTGIVSSIMVQRAKSRVKDIQKQQKDMVDRWGVEVTGTIPVDEFGFPKGVATQGAEE